MSPPTSKRPLSPAITIPRTPPPAHSSTFLNPASLHPLPKFLTQPLPTLNQKFKALNMHQSTVLRTPDSVLPIHVTRERNRYPDIHPWAHNRVVLKAHQVKKQKGEKVVDVDVDVDVDVEIVERLDGKVEDEDGDINGGEEVEDGEEIGVGYINASPIELGREERYIATQGPLERSGGISAFWEMCWQEGVEVIVMLTRCVEDGREKCGVYYPEVVGGVRDVGDGWGEVVCVDCREENRTEIRELSVRRLGGEEGEEEERTMWHFLFIGWPDMEVPREKEDQKNLLELIRMSRFRIDERAGTSEEARKEVEEKNSKPTVVHCSAGVGRTGTFIALDHLLKELEEGKLDGLVEEDNDDVDPIFDTVKRLREQRMFMVYQPGQYAFIYQILRERWEDRQKGRNTPVAKEASPKDAEGSPTKKRKHTENGAATEVV